MELLTYHIGYLVSTPKFTGSMFPKSNSILSHYYEEYFLEWPAPELTEHDVGFMVPFSLDKTFNQYPQWSLYLRQTWWVPLAVSVLYCLGVRWGQSVMASRKPFELRSPLAAWNLILAVFSIVGTYKTVPYFLYALASNGPTYYLCRRAAASYFQGGEVALWSLAFALSKYAELIDTLFLVLRKKPVPFLHWYHHASVILISIYSAALEGPSGILMVTMNYFVHSVMYTYYFLAAVIAKPPRWGNFVTTLQIAQMIVGCVLAVALYAVNYVDYFKVENCCHVPSNIATVAAIYTSYLVLFLQFYFRRYRSPRKAE